MHKLGALLLTLATALYPLAIYAGLGRHSPALLAGVLGLAWLLRLLAWRERGPRFWLSLLAVLGYCGLLGWQPWPDIERWYPVIVNAALAMAFGISLWRGMPAIERLARLTEPDLPPEGIAYTRKVTWVWLIFFVLNGSLAAGLSRWGSLRWWTLYNGFIAYLLIGLLFAIEYGLRRRAKRRHRPS